LAAFNLLEPVSPESPCGPDLERQDDPEFLEYYFEAESRLPERYFTPGLAADGREDRLFDPRSIDLAAETATITGMLRRSRDLRLLSLLARFQILAGRLEEFSVTLEDIAAVMAEWPGELHPSGAERRAAIDSLNNQPTVVMPLLHLSLLPNSEVTLRRFMVVSGKVTPRASERDLEGADFLGPLRADSNQRAVVTAHERLNRAAAALYRIQQLAASHPDKPLHLDLGALRTALADMQAMIATARPELQPWSASAEPAPSEPVEPLVEVPPVGAIQMPPTASAPPAAPLKIANRATASAALDAARTWLAAQEPSSPALMLVAQARALIGKPLVEAIEVLMPREAPAATLRIGQGSPFVLPMDRLKALTQTGLEGQSDPPGAVAQMPPITQRAELVGKLLEVERYFATCEPASPVPLLLAKAREMLDKRFDAIIAELLASPAPSGQA
jgi:type VI secretion system protein ImpA